MRKNPAIHNGLIEDWRPEDETFWKTTGRRIARRNLWISVPALLLAFSVWMVWSVVVAKLPAIGFTYTTDQLFWLAAAIGVLLTLPSGSGSDDATGFVVAFMLLFLTAGVGNGSVFHVVPTVFRRLHEGWAAGQPEAARDASISAGEIEASVALGFTASVAALGLFLIPALVAVSIESTGTPRLALFGFIAFYVTCLFVTWWWYRRRGAEVRCD